jgi:FkbH-like protein
MRLVDLYWLPQHAGAHHRLPENICSVDASWPDLVSAAKLRLNFLQTNQLDRVLLKRGQAAGASPADTVAHVMRLAILSSSTAKHLSAGIRVGGLRRSLAVEVYTGPYGLYMRELQDRNSGLQKFSPGVVLFAFHAQHLFGQFEVGLSAEESGKLLDSAARHIVGAWRLARGLTDGQIIQQTVASTYPSLMGSNEHRLPGSGAALVDRLNERIRQLAEEEGVDVLAIDSCMARDGQDAWHDPGLWHLAKQEFSPVAGPAYGDLLMRLVDAQRGRSFKCLVLDLDNTLWGGSIGEDGLEGIQLGSGSALGEAYVAFQRYLRDLSKRGIVLAVCSKNDPVAARSPFDAHPEMVLRQADIACFVANWDDKATNLRAIAAQLGIGVDSLVFVDDSPFERDLARRELPMVAVPELPEDPAFFARCIADAGYFEATRISTEDLARNDQYQNNLAREQLHAAHTDLAGYLQSLNMELHWSPFDGVSLQRVVQLGNKTNQFNLRTARYTESQMLAIMQSAGVLTLQLRLIDRFGDNGIIGMVIGVLSGKSLRLDAWLMSCRVLGRRIEEVTMNLIVEEAGKLGASELQGEYLPTKRNGMVHDLYPRLGFERVALREDGSSLWVLQLSDYVAFDAPIALKRSEARG